MTSFVKMVLTAKDFKREKGVKKFTNRHDLKSCSKDINFIDFYVLSRGGVGYLKAISMSHAFYRPVTDREANSAFCDSICGQIK